MQSSESILTKHAKKFIYLEHERDEVRGITYDGKGNAWVSDGFMVLKVSGFEVDGEPVVKDLKGKKLNVTPNEGFVSGRFLPDYEVKGIIYPVDALKQLKPIQVAVNAVKGVGNDFVSLSVSNRNFKISFKNAELSGETRLKSNCNEFNMKVSINRLVDCLSVFGKCDSVTVRQGGFMLQFHSDGLATGLMGVR